MTQRGEFQIIEQFFTHAPFGAWTSQGPGDDCALIDIGGRRIAVTCDMAALGTHFLPDADPEDVGYKALAVNLSDLAAAGAVPRAFFLSIGLPRRDDGWLADFSRGMMALAQSTGCALLGGDTTRTPEVARARSRATTSGSRARWGTPTRRSAAARGTGTRCPTPSRSSTPAWTARCRGWPSARRSLTSRRPRRTSPTGSSPTSGTSSTARGFPPKSSSTACPARPLSGGDDYELVFTAPAELADRVRAIGVATNTLVTRIGRIEKRTSTALVVRSVEGLLPLTAGFDHFAAEEA